MYSKTKKIILLAIILSFVQLLIFSGTSFSGIKFSGHDLTPSGPGQFMYDSGGEICIFCHTPHQAIVTDDFNNNLPLWNKSLSGITGFSLYSSDTFNAGPTGTDTQTQPQGVSLLCLSCHDGTSAINVVQNYPYTFDPIAGSPTTIGEVPGLAINIGESIKDLSNDHPISFVYNNALVTADGGTGLKDPNNIAPLKLFGNNKDMLECATCHNPHEQGIEGLPGSTYPFLRMSNDASAMCIKCHNK